MNTQIAEVMNPAEATTIARSAGGQRPNWLQADLYPFQNHTIEIAGNRVHYIDEGAGSVHDEGTSPVHDEGTSPIILFLHGLPAWSFMYRDLIKELRSRFRCIALDLPGFGLSKARPGYSYSVVDQADVVEQFVRALDLKDVILAVHDSGGPIGFGVAGRHPERFQAFIISNSFAWTLDQYPFVKYFLKAVGSSLFGFLNVNLNLLVRGFVRSLPFSAAEKAAYTGPFQDRSRRKAMHLAFRSLSRRTDYLGRVEVGLEGLKDRPALILWGKGDSTYSAGFHQRFAETFVESQLEIIFEGNSQTGHFPQEGNAAGMVKAIYRWWAATFDKSVS